MTVKQKDVIDWVGVEKGTGHIVLTVVSDIVWSIEDLHIVTVR
jgi:hypothetical protein